VAEGKCPEGKMTCGKINEVKDYFAAMKRNDK
jgi:thymidylate synthase (FAD)